MESNKPNHRRRSSVADLTQKFNAHNEGKLTPSDLNSISSRNLKIQEKSQDTIVEELRVELEKAHSKIKNLEAENLDQNNRLNDKDGKI